MNIFSWDGGAPTLAGAGPPVTPSSQGSPVPRLSACLLSLLVAGHPPSAPAQGVVSEEVVVAKVHARSNYPLTIKLDPPETGSVVGVGSISIRPPTGPGDLLKDKDFRLVQFQGDMICTLRFRVDYHEGNVGEKHQFVRKFTITNGPSGDSRYVARMTVKYFSEPGVFAFYFAGDDHDDSNRHYDYDEAEDFRLNFY